jgi:hypothetical protein
VPAGLLRPGRYIVTPMVIQARHFRIDRYEAGRFSFEVSGVGYHFETTRWGVITPLLAWSTAPAAEVAPAVLESSE